MTSETLPAQATGTHSVSALRIERGQAQALTETVAEETAIALVFNGISHAVMMASPLDLEDFALGFALSEAIIAKPSELIDLDVVPGCDGIAVEITLVESRFQALKAVRRSMAGRTGCGLCGYESLDAAIRPLNAVTSDQQLDAAEISAAMAVLHQAQPLNAATGATHVAMWWRPGQVIAREDVGRHNALDKLIGATAREADRSGIIVMSSRASYEIVHKAAAAGFSVVAAVSAPTALAIRMAEQAGITLIGFARGERMTVYSHPQRIRETAG
ncbi:formate dehydrogenase accessory sulfurtransferase FdhD [Amantichitinum ursilacus]|uniref:Sulfur carrier protein FdhD n=1 Tax=Amantichitinum ursilacus TaxID=857265 RepID=A0A0N1JRS7_9NEIS|nr:formate dehydrogenase accessory sulfurtransferase FdhD [Amantichitinum ursilacus]KPC50422.1 formate dehydrogenase accessory protein [Amantichitinum ursilacus]